MNVIVLVLVLLAPSFTTIAQATSDDAFLGIFTTDTYAIDGCRIIKLGSVQKTVDRLWGPQGENDRDSNYFWGNLGSRTYDTKLLIKDAVQRGYNAILGYRLEITSAYDGFGGRTINGMAGYGEALVTHYGTPALIRCEDSPSSQR